MERDIKLVVLDLDHTTAQDDNTVTPHTAQVFARVKEKGIKLAVATGRAVDEADFVADALGADEYMIALTGCQLYDRRAGRDLFLHHFTSAQAVAIARILQRAEETYFHLYAAEGLITTPGAAPFIDECPTLPDGYPEYAHTRMVMREDAAAYLEKNGKSGAKYFVLSNNYENLAALRAQVEKIEGVSVVQSLRESLEIMPAGADKGRALRALKEHLGVSTEQVMAVGDSENDLAMFREAGLKVAVGNAFARVKAQADFVAPRYDEDGAAFAAEKFLLAGGEG